MVCWHMQDLSAVMSLVSSQGGERPHLSGRQRHGASLRCQRVQQLPDERGVPDQEHACIQPCSNNPLLSCPAPARVKHILITLQLSIPATSMELVRRTFITLYRQVAG